MNVVIYCRVSSREQVDGTSLESQEASCRDYARRNNMNVLQVFVEEGESARVAHRTQLLRLLDFCKHKSQKVEKLLVWKLDRFARNIEDHYALKAILRKLGVEVLSVTEPIKADATGKLMEAILAGYNEFDSDLRSIRTLDGMQRRLREGIFPWLPPLGYLPPKIGPKKEPDSPDPQRFDLLKRAWGLFATGVYSKAAILRLLQKWGVKGRRGEPLSEETLSRIFRNPYYAGIIRNPWTKEECEGRHQAMVSSAEFARVQEVLDRQNNSQPHILFHPSFPARGHVKCPQCKGRLTGSWSKGRRKRYAYYHCNRHGCRRISYAAWRVHDEVTERLSDIAVPRDRHDALAAMLLEASKGATEQTHQELLRHSELVKLRAQLRELITMRAKSQISDAEFADLQRDVKQEIWRLEAAAPKNDVEPLSNDEVNDLMRSLADLDKTWRMLPPRSQHTMLQLVFPSGFVFQRSGTAELGLIFRTFEASKTPNLRLVPEPGESWNNQIASIRSWLAIFQTNEKSKNKAA